jgi:hypothetical protein
VNKKERKDLRGFSIAFFIILAFFGGLNIYRQAVGLQADGFLAGGLLAGIGVLLLLGGLFAPFVLKPVYWLWRKVTLVISTIVMTVLLTALYYLFYTPIAFILRSCRKEVIPLGRDAGKATYWEKRIIKDETLEDLKHQF